MQSVSNDNQLPEPSVNTAFARVLAERIDKFNHEKYVLPTLSVKLSDLAKDLNAMMATMAGRASVREDELHPITTYLLNKMLNSEIGLTPELLEAMPHVFKIFGDEREAFLAVGQQAVRDEKVRRKEVWRASPEGQAATLKEQIANEADTQNKTALKLAEARLANNKQAWKENNPEGMEQMPSFQEMLETSHANGEDFKQFLFDRVMPSWGNMSQVAFCSQLRKLNEGRESDAKATITDTVLSSWRAGKTKPLRDSLDVICRAFGIAPEEGELIALHEKMLWKAIDGHAFSWGDKKGVSALEDAIREVATTGDTGTLVAELIDSSGIRYERLKEMLKVEQIPQWKKGAKIENVEMALKFLQLVNPQPTEELSGTVSRQNKALLSLITGREFDIEKILENANKHGNPGGDLFTSLTGRNGMVTIRPNEIVKHFEAAGRPCPEERIKKMRTGTQLQGGGKIFEQDAKIILELVNDKTSKLVKLGICKPLTAEQKERCIDTLTGVPHPKKMLDSAVKGELPIGELVSKTCDRLDLNHNTGEGHFCEQVGISHMSGFVTGKSSLEPETAEKMANWFAAHYDFDEEQQKQFISLARGVNLQRTPDMILDEFLAGKIGRVTALREIYDYSGLPRPALAEQAGVEFRSIQYSITETSGGRIMADKNGIKRIARVCGVSEARINDFVNNYDGNKVSRQSVLSSKGDKNDDSWVDHAKDSKSTEGWARSKAAEGGSD